MGWKIPLFKIYWDQEDVKAVSDVIKRGSYWATGPEIKDFEEKIAEYVDRKYAVAFNSGTSALHAILLACNIGPGDEVIVPSFTFIATANASLFVGAKPVFAEIEGETYGLDPKDVEKKITKKTKAIIPIHYGGCPCLSIKELRKIANKHNLLLIEDAAESLGAKIGNKMVGTFGDTAMFSFCQNKIITTGEGGVVVTNSEKIYKKLKLLVSHGRKENGDYFSSAEKMNHVTLGYNFRMPSMIASLGTSQLKKITQIIKMRRKNAKYYTSCLSKIKEIKLPVSPNNFFHVYQLYTIQVDKDLRGDLKNYLTQKGIFSKVYFDSIHLTKFYREKFGSKKGDLPVAEEISKRVLSLPIFPDLSKKEIDYIGTNIIRFFKKK